MIDKNPLSTLLLKSTTQFSDNIAIRSDEGDISYSALKDLVSNLALHLVNSGVRQGVIVAIEKDGSNNILEIISILSLTLLGCTWIVFDQNYLRRKTIKIDFIIAKQLSKLSGHRILHITKDNCLKRPENFRAKKRLNFPGYLSVNDPWYIATSSGTTGEPKLMPISSQIFYERILRYREYENDQEQLLFFDTFRQTSNLANLHFFFTIFKGGTYLLYNSYEKLIEANVKYVVGSPMHLLHLIQNIPEPQRPSIQEARIVGSALSEQFLKKLLNYFQTVRVSYGSTEAGQVTTKLLHRHTVDKSVGKVYPGVDLEIVDDNDMPVEPTVEGRVRIKTKGQISGYLNPKEAAPESFKSAWFYPGDKGYFSLDRELYVVGRDKDQLNIGGVKVNAAAIDELLQKSEGIVDAISFAESNTAGIDELSALIKIEEDLSSKSVIRKMAEHFNTQLPRMKSMLRNIYVSQEIPRNANGKVMRHKVYEMIDGQRPIRLNYSKIKKRRYEKEVQKK